MIDSRARPNMRVSIHQPNFLPWIGYFGKILKSDVFIFLDDVQIQRTAGSWTNRVKILSGGSPKWLTAPIKRPSGMTQTISNTEFAEDGWVLRCKSDIKNSYRKAPHFKEITKLLDEIFQSSPQYLAEFNQTVILKMLHFLQLPSPIIKISSDFKVSSTSTDRLVDLILSVNGDEYLCGRGSDSYLEPGKFSKAGIKLTMQVSTETPYSQIGVSEFIPGLSIIDALMMTGPQNVRRLLSESVN